MRCLAKDRNQNGCRNHAIGETRLCKFHDHMMDYTDEMIENATLCSGCNKMHYMVENEKTCDKCRQRTKKNRELVREHVVLCKKEGCKFKQSDERGYCQKHQVCILIEEVGSRNKRLCVNYVRGCREELELDYKTSRCGNCLEKDRDKDQQRRKNAKETSKQTLNNAIEKPCTVCCKVMPITMFEGIHGQTKTCITCRHDNKKQDANRDREHRNTLSRQRIFYNYKKWAKQRNILFSIDKDIFESMIKTPCNYCGILQDSGFNGIDRKDSKGIYETDNCVSCCQMCNYLKGTDTIEAFTQRIQHMLTYNKCIEGQLFPGLFSNHTHVSYTIYQKSAVKRNIDFLLTEEQFNDITKNDCYLCGKSNTDIHTNGIDRFDSSIGYILYNCRACCHSCNFMKNDYKFVDMIQKMKTIYTFTSDGSNRPSDFASNSSTF